MKLLLSMCSNNVKTYDCQFREAKKIYSTSSLIDAYFHIILEKKKKKRGNHTLRWLTSIYCWLARARELRYAIESLFAIS